MPVTVPLTTLIPVLALLLLGQILRRRNWAPPDLWPRLDQLVYYVLAPALVFERLARSELIGVNIMTPALVIALTAGVSLLVVLVLAAIGRLGPRAVSVIAAAGWRPSPYLALSLGMMVFNQPGFALASILIAVMIPISTFLVAIVLKYNSREVSPGLLPSLSRAILDPIVIAAVMGCVVSLGRVPLPETVMSILLWTGVGAMPLALIALGGQLNFNRPIRPTGRELASAALRLIIQPLLAYLVAIAVGLSGITLALVVLLMALPASPFAPGAQRWVPDLDGEVTRSVVWQHGLALITIPLTIVALR